MGSKRFMLENGLGEILRAELPRAKRFIDPFCGAGSIVNFVAKNKNFNKPIIAGDLQRYSAVLANSVIGRTIPTDPDALKTVWLEVVKKKIVKSELYNQALKNDEKFSKDGNIESWVKRSRKLCKTISKTGPVWNAYGGHYYSPKQALIFDYLLKNIPNDKHKDVYLAALITAAARCAASPGHTAQPFQPTSTAGKFIKVAWSLDPFKSCETALKEISPLHATVKGKAIVSDAKKLVKKTKKGDLVLLDPPYSGVQYSRFYHVLETIAKGKVGKVSGIGRYPSIEERPQSRFSNSGQSVKALEELLSELAKREAVVIFTFPKGKCSNGLSGDKIVEVATKYFHIDKGSRVHKHTIIGKFSTLGGNNKLKLKNNLTKPSRVNSEEILLLLKPKKHVG